MYNNKFNVIFDEIEKATKDAREAATNKEFTSAYKHLTRVAWFATNALPSLEIEALLNSTRRVSGDAELPRIGEKRSTLRIPLSYLGD